MNEVMELKLFLCRIPQRLLVLDEGLTYAWKSINCYILLFAASLQLLLLLLSLDLRYVAQIELWQGIHD